MKKVNDVTEKIRLLKETEEIYSPTNFSIPIKTSFGLSQIKLVHPDKQERLAEDSIRIVRTGNLERSFFSMENRSIIISVKHIHLDDFQASEKYVAELKNIIDSKSFDSYGLAGRATVQSEFVELIKSDFGVFIVLAFGIIILFLKIQYGAWPAVFVPLLLIATTIITTLGIMVGLGYPLNILTVLIPTIISFVAISDVIHFYTKFHVSLIEGLFHQNALLKTVKEIGLATFLTSLTTAIGFISLISIKVVPVQLLGVFTAVGVFVAFIFTFILLPYFSKHLIQKKEGKTRIWQSFSLWCFNIAKNNQILILGLSFLLIIGGIVGASQIKIDAYLLDDLPESSFSRKSFESIDVNFGGTKPWNLYFYSPDSSSIVTEANA